MSRIKLYLLGFITLFTTIAALGQKPKDCITLPPGMTPGGTFNLTPNYACINTNTGTAIVTVTNAKPPTGIFDVGAGNEIKYNFNYTDALFPTGVEFTAGTPPIYTYNQAGEYWVAVSGKQGSNTYLMCKSVEVIKTEQPDIKVDACDPLNVSVEIQDTPINQKQDRVTIDWGDGNINTYDVTSRPMTISHSYTSAPTSNPKIQGQYVRGGVNRCPSDPVNFNVGTNINPKISELEGLNGGTENKITMKDGNPGEDYIIEMSTNNGTWAATSQTIKAPTASNTSSATITGLNATNEYCFRLSKAGACATSIQSNVVCTIKPTYNVLSPKEVKVDWVNNQSNITGYEIIYKESITGYNQNSGFKSPSEKTYTFDQMDCSKKYDFQIIGKIDPGTPANRVIIKSPTFIVDPATGGKLPSSFILIVSAANNKNEVSLNMLSVLSINKYNIYRAEGNSTNFQLINSTTSNAFQDQNVEINKQQYCYKVDYEDACGNVSEQSPSACTVFLTSAQPNTVNWSPFTVVGSPDILQGVEATEYTIEIYDQNGNLKDTKRTFDTEADIQYELDTWLKDPIMGGKVVVRIFAQQKGRVILSTGTTIFPFYGFSNEYTFLTPAQVYFPSAFTPNDDGKNDLFEVKGKYIAQFNMIIYDRWGAPIFESKDIKIGWDGKENGSPAPTGYYSFKIFGIDNAGQEFSKTGSVLLMR